MKTLTLSVWLTLSMLAGCAVTDPSQSTPNEVTEANDVTGAAPGEDIPLDKLLPGAEPSNAAAAFCSTSRAACLTASQCHHQEGTNIGVGTCPSGTTCCVFF
jgi:hypothetical protein